MTTALCIETSGAHCSVALRHAGCDYHAQELLRRRHNERLLSMLDEVFRRADCAPVALDVVGFGNGPGSFTGVRMAASVTQALCFASGALAVPMASSRVWSLSARAAGASSGEHLISIRSRGTAHYLSLYAAPGQAQDAAELIRGDTLCSEPPAWLAQCAEPIWLVGDVPDWLPPQWPERHYACEPRAEVMLDETVAAHLAGRSVPAQAALPTYIQGDSPWKKASAT